ncbi:lytic transglycosylase domain-containing protein [Pelagibacterium halotolerans]|uniref:lytic transglycosylase domain-containing protein n=1 Tax=Pelagibacterium halotolerans TaxID=531813 RepID=UPI00384DEBCC
MPAARNRNAAGRSFAARRVAFLFLSCLGLASDVHVSLAQSAPAAAASRTSSYAAFVSEAAQRFGIPEQWILAVMQAESRGHVGAVSSRGAMGLMQIMPGTWTELRARHRLGADPFDARDNILAGAAYLREMFDRYGDPIAMLAAYNAGPGRYDEHLATGRSLPAETRAYLAELAPLVGAETSTIPASVTPDWRDVPLFVARTSGNSTAQTVQAGGATADVVGAFSPRESDAAVPSVDGISAIHSGGGERP